MKLLSTIFIAGLCLTSCTTTTTKNADGSSVTVRKPDYKTIHELEPILNDAVQAGVKVGVEAAVQALKEQAGNNQ